MNIFFTNKKFTLFFTSLFIASFLFNNNTNAQQVLGTNGNIDAGFESQSAGNLGTTASLTVWTYVLSGNGQTRTISSSGGYGGPVFLTGGKSAGATQNSSTTFNSNQVGTNTFLADRKYIIQFHYKANAANASTPDPASTVFISADGTSGNRISTNISLGTPTAWTKFTSIVTTNNVTSQTATGTCGINIRTTTIGTAALVDVDNFVVYPADDQATPVPDITAPAAPTAFAAVGNPAIVNLSWNAPVGGTDAGGYIVVRFTSDPGPSLQPDPLQNAVYKANVANVIGTTGQVVYVGDSTVTSFNDGSATVGVNYWYRVYAVDKAFNYSAAATTVGPVSPLNRVNFYYNGVGSADNVTSWFANANFTGANPSNFTAAGQIFRIITNATLPSTLSISGTGSLLMIGAPSPGVNAVTVNFNTTVLPAIDTIYQSSNGLPTILNFNTSTVPSINQLFDIFTEVHYRSPGIAVSTSKTYDKIFVENNADVIFNGIPVAQTNFTVTAGSTATVGTLSTRWLAINSGGTAVINGTLKVPKLVGLVSSSVTPSSAGGAIQFVGTEALTLGPNSTIEFSGISTGTTQTVTPRTDYANLTISGVGISKTFSGATTVAGNFTINTTGTGQSILNAPLTVNGGLTLTSGILTTDATNILTLGSAAAVTGGSNTSFINGPIRINTNATNTYALPIGKGTNYEPAAIKPNASTASVYIAEAFNTAFSNTTSLTTPLTGVSITEYWNITKVSGADATVSLSLAGTAITNATASDALVVAQFTGGSWLSRNATPIGVGNATTGTATSSLISTFGTFGFGIVPSSAVPLKLTSFKVQLINDVAQLTWTTQQEENMLHFVIERSENGILFNSTSIIDAKNNLNNNYSFNDNALIKGTVFYRLKLIDQDGKFTYSNTVIIKSKTAAIFTVFSNPVKNKLVQLQISNVPKNVYSLAICDLTGKILVQKNINYNGVSVSENLVLSNAFARGLYIVKLVGNGVNETIQIFVD